MADPVPAGSEVSAGTYRCTQCGKDLTVLDQAPAPVQRLRKRFLPDDHGRRQRRRPLSGQGPEDPTRLNRRALGLDGVRVYAPKGGADPSPRPVRHLADNEGR